MSKQVIALNNGRQAIINTTTAKVALWGYRTAQRNLLYDNSTYDDVTIQAGTVLGSVAATEKLVPLAPGASDGSQFPCGVLLNDHVVLASTELDGEVSYIVSGDVNESELALPDGYTLASVVSGRTLRDWLLVMGIKPITTTEMTAYDNS